MQSFKNEPKNLLTNLLGEKGENISKINWES